MVRITEELVRKKSEHNERMISTLEELTLHQEDIEKIEHLQNWCRHLKILLLQNNLIAKIENLHKLKELVYLNLAINNIERIENLEKLESLAKLDLTLNFIGELTSIENLRDNYNLRILNLTGNPCTDYPGYREFVITVLPQLESLDGNPITMTERLVAQKKCHALRKVIVNRQIECQIQRDEQKIRVAQQRCEQELEFEGLDEAERLEKFWNSKSEHCPETRIEISKKNRESRKLDEPEPTVEKPQRKLFTDLGRPYCINEPRLQFDFCDEHDRYELNVHVYKFLDTSLVEVDAQVNYIRVTVKGKIFQIGLAQEICVDASSSKRSTCTGHLLIVMPKLKYDKNLVISKIVDKKRGTPAPVGKKWTAAVDYRNIVKQADEFDESEVPPLI